jgi:hypothetical protein
MVIEHVFVSTLPATDVLAGATAYLAARGFQARRESDFQIGLQEWTAMEMQRGKTNANRARSIAQLPQAVRVEYDRGRVTVALSIAVNSTWGGNSTFTFSGGLVENRKKMRLHTELLLAIAKGLEQLLGHDQHGQPDYKDWDRVEGEVAIAARRKKRRQIILVAVIFAILIGTITLIVIAVG